MESPKILTVTITLRGFTAFPDRENILQALADDLHEPEDVGIYVRDVENIEVKWEEME